MNLMLSRYFHCSFQQSVQHQKKTERGKPMNRGLARYEDEGHKVLEEEAGGDGTKQRRCLSNTDTRGLQIGLAFKKMNGRGFTVWYLVATQTALPRRPSGKLYRCEDRKLTKNPLIDACSQKKTHTT